MNTIFCQSVGAQHAMVVFPEEFFWTTAILLQPKVALINPLVVFSQIEPLKMRLACPVKQLANNDLARSSRNQFM
jgi:hypothetical protein